MSKSLIKDTKGTLYNQKRYAYLVDLNEHFTYWTSPEMALIQARFLSKKGVHITYSEDRVIKRFVDLLPDNNIQVRMEVIND